MNVVPSSSAWQRVRNAIRQVESGKSTFRQSPAVPYYVFPAVVFKVTGDIDGDGYYPGLLLAWDSDSETWVELEECYIKQGATA